LGQGTEVLRAGDFTRYGNDYLGLVALFMDRYALRPLRKHQAALRRGDATVWIATFERTAYAQTGVNLGFVACALERYRLAHGEYPEKLGSLVPTFAEKLPDDVVSGKPLLYRRGEGRSYVLYSLGWNEKDDGGQAALYEIVYFTGGVQTKGQRADINQGDWVWAIPAEK
jgi:hypothetical protein